MLFDGTDYQVFTQHATRPPPLEKLTEAGAPPEVVALLGDMLAKNREDRPADHGALITRLRRVLRGGSATSVPLPPPPAPLVLKPFAPREVPPGTPTIAVPEPPMGKPYVAPRAPMSRKRQRMLLAVVLAVVVLLVALLLGRWLLDGKARLTDGRPGAFEQLA